MEASKRMRAFDLPKMHLKDVSWYDNDEIINRLTDASSMLVSYRTKEGDSEFLFTGLGEEEFRTFISQVNRHIPLYEFVKSAIQNIDLTRQNELEGQLHMIEAVKYLKLKNQAL